MRKSKSTGARSRILAGAMLALLVSTAAPVRAESAQEKFTAAEAKWKAVNEKLDGVYRRFRSAPATERQALLKEYSDLVSEAEKLLPGLRIAAREAYAEAPNSNEDNTNALVGLLAYDNRQGNFQEAYATGKLLADNDCQIPGFAALFVQAAFNADDVDSARKQLEKAKQAGKLSDEEKLFEKELALRDAEAKADDLPRVKLSTTKGDVVLELFENEAPQTVGNFISLVEDGFYNGKKFHRVIPGFMAQGGCPKGDGTGGPGYKIYCECGKPNHRKHFRGVLSMAHAGPNTGGSQFFITFDRTPHLDGKHTVFGRVLEGQTMVVDKLQATEGPAAGDGEPDKIIKAEVLRKRDHEYKPTKVD
jgi:cyclophilin family peptidyl-prolyl cis-trans isomerase